MSRSTIVNKDCSRLYAVCGRRRPSCMYGCMYIQDCLARVAECITCQSCATVVFIQARWICTVRLRWDCRQVRGMVRTQLIDQSVTEHCHGVVLQVCCGAWFCTFEYHTLGTGPFMLCKLDTAVITVHDSGLWEGWKFFGPHLRVSCVTNADMWRSIEVSATVCCFSLLDV